jgi:hypothetical protein
MAQAGQPTQIIWRYEDALQMRQALGDHGRKKHRSVLNMALKYVRLVSTHSDGSPAISQWDFSKMPADMEWSFPGWRKHGKGSGNA